MAKKGIVQFPIFSIFNRFLFLFQFFENFNFKMQLITFLLISEQGKQLLYNYIPIWCQLLQLID